MVDLLEVLHPGLTKPTFAMESNMSSSTTLQPCNKSARNLVSEVSYACLNNLENISELNMATSRSVIENSALAARIGNGMDIKTIGSDIGQPVWEEALDSRRSACELFIKAQTEVTGLITGYVGESRTSQTDFPEKLAAMFAQFANAQRQLSKK